MKKIITITMNPSIDKSSSVEPGSAAEMTPGTELCRREDTERLFKEM